MGKKTIRQIYVLCVSLFFCVMVCDFGPVRGSELQSEKAPFEITKKVEKLTAGKTYQLKTNAASKVIWTSSDLKVASVNKAGKIKAKRYGKTKITAQCDGEKVSFVLQVKGKKIVGIDPGHQSRGNSSTEPSGPGSSVYKAKVSGGTCGVATRKPEYKLTMEIGASLEKELWNRGYQVVMTRTKNDVNISNKERAQLINDSGANICVRLHADGGPSSARGASVLCPSTSNRYVGNLSAKSKRLSEAILDKYIEATGLRKRGLSYRDDLTGTNWSKVPVTLIELGFMTNSAEDNYMSSAAGQKAMVKGLADGIDSYYGY